jgi:hypothetical protein
MSMPLETCRVFRTPVIGDLDPDESCEPAKLSERSLSEMVASGHTLTETLDAICHHAEAAIEGARCGIYRIDWSGPGFLSFAAPSLPAALRMSLSALPLRRDAGPCARAACLRIPVIATDLETDPLWQHSAFRTLAVAYGLRFCWSTAIHAETGQVLGTLAILRPQPLKPTSRLQEIVDRLTRMAAVAIERTTTEAALDNANAEFTRAAVVSAIGARIVGEMVQPLSGIVINASTGLRMLTGSPPNVEGACETLRRTLRDCHRASEMITQLRVLLHSKETGAAPFRSDPAGHPHQI